MPSLYTYYLFISHAWKYSEGYHQILNLLNEASNFQFRNYSVPEHDPADANSPAKLEKALKEQMGPAQVIIILAGMYVNHSGWIQFEVNYAVACNKPIIVVEPRGAERTPAALQNLPNSVIVGWSTSSIVSAIRNAVK